MTDAIRNRINKHRYGRDERKWLDDIMGAWVDDDLIPKDEHKAALAAARAEGVAEGIKQCWREALGNKA